MFTPKIVFELCFQVLLGVPGGRGALPYLNHVSMRRPKGYGFCDVFGLTTGIDFAHFSLESGLNFEKTMGVYERIHHFNPR